MLQKQNTESKYNAKEKAILLSTLQTRGGSKIDNGTYTIFNPKTGEHRTIKIDTVLDKNSGLFGKRVVSLLVGSNNESDYLPFGFLNSDSIYVYQRFQALGQDAKVEDRNFYTKLASLAYSLLKEGNKSKFAAFGLTVTASKQCLLCSKKLTDQSSLNMGIGPICASKVM